MLVLVAKQISFTGICFVQSGSFTNTGCAVFKYGTFPISFLSCRRSMYIQLFSVIFFRSAWCRVVASLLVDLNSCFLFLTGDFNWFFTTDATELLIASSLIYVWWIDSVSRRILGAATTGFVSKYIRVLECGSYRDSRNKRISSFSRPILNISCSTCLSRVRLTTTKVNATSPSITCSDWRNNSWSLDMTVRIMAVWDDTVSLPLEKWVELSLLGYVHVQINKYPFLVYF